MHTAAATPAFRLSCVPRMGIATVAAVSFFTTSESPFASLPIASAILPYARKVNAGSSSRESV